MVIATEMLRDLPDRRDLPALALLALACVFLYADQNLMAPNLSAIATEFGFDAVERDVKLGGHIALAYWLLGGGVTLVVGWMTDRLPRRGLFVAVLLLGEIPCLLTGFVQSYEQLFWCRALTGVGLGGALPLAFSMVSDWFPAKNRPAACAVLGFSMGLGMGMGQFLSGMVGPSLGWRLPFILVALPNLLLAGVFWWVAREPARGRSEDALRELVQAGHAYTGRIDWARYREIFRVPTNRLVLAQALLGSLPWGVFFVFMTDFYAQDKGFGVQRGTIVVMASGITVLLGGLAGGFLGAWLYQRKPRYLPMLCAVTTTVGVLPTAWLINYPSQVGVEQPGLLLPVIASLACGLFIGVTGPNIRAVLLDSNPPEVRGSVVSLYTLCNDLGMGLGPVVVAALVAWQGRLVALNLANGLWLVAGVVLFAVVRAFPRDERLMQQRLAAIGAGVRAGSPPEP